MRKTGASFLTDSDAVIEGLTQGGVGLWRWAVGTDKLEWTANLEAVHNLPAGSFDGTLASFHRDIHPEDAPAVWREIEATLATGEPFNAVYRTAPGDGEEPRWIRTRGGLVEGNNGQKHLTGMCIDVTDRVRTAHELERRLTNQRAVSMLGSFALAESDFQKILDEALRTATDVYRVPLASVLQFSDSADHLLMRAGIGWHEGLVGRATVSIEPTSQAGFTLQENRPVVVHDLRTETRFSEVQILNDHGVRSGITAVIPGTEGRPFGVLGVHTPELREFTESEVRFMLSLGNIIAGAARQAAAAEHHMLLLREMAHRAGNMLQLVSSIASQTFKTQHDPELAQRSFVERLNALARANYVVGRGGWIPTRFGALVEEVLLPLRERFSAEGPDVLLPPELCFDIGLVLHELSTNSVKYGTLGRGEGSVTVRWWTALAPGGTRTFSFAWEDPQVGEADPGSQGFGSKLIAALIERKWNGSLRRETNSGFRLTFEVPLPARPD